MAELTVSLFGPFKARLDGEEITAFKSQKVRALLAYLAIEVDRAHSREKLAALFWPEYPAQEARNNLRYALYNLRKAIRDQAAEPPFLIIESETIQFNQASRCGVDVNRFMRLLRRDNGRDDSPEDLQEAVALVQGEFLEGFAIPDSLELDEWITRKRSETHRMLVQSLQALAAHYEKNGEYGLAADCARRQIEEEPWDEIGHRRLMRVLTLDGQPGTALVHYEHYSRQLYKELGIQPAEETQALADQIRSDSRALQQQARPVSGQKPGHKLGQCPYRGLASFREQDAAFFFGRNEVVDSLLQRFKEQPLVVVVVGSSGSGKSSLVFAGLVPALRSLGDWLIVDIRPGHRPFHALSAALIPWLEPELTETERLIEAQKLADAIRGGEIMLQAVLLRILEIHPQVKHLLLFSDQFEELYTLCPEPEMQQSFINTLLNTAESIGERRAAQLRILLTLRADFMGQALGYRRFADALQQATHMLGPMSREELRSAVERPAEIQGARFEKGLIARILDDVGDQPGNLPLLEFALTLLWEGADADGVLTHQAYEHIGQVEGALTQYAERVFCELSASDQKAARQIFMQLLQPGRGTEDTRRVAYRGELVEENWPLVQYLADKRLVVTNLEHGGLETVEIVHEALIQRWERLRSWIDTDRAFRTWQESLRVSIYQWEAANRDQSGLLRGVPLAQAENWLAERSSELSDLEKQFIQECAAQREHELIELQIQQEKELEKTRALVRTERRSRRFLGALAGVLALAVLVTTLLGAFARQQRQEALLAYSLSLAASAEQALADHDTATALSLALAANRVADPPRPVQRILLNAAYAPGARSRQPLSALFPGVSAPGTSLALSGQAERVLIGLEDGRLVVWQPEAGSHNILSGHTGRVNDVAISSDGRRALSSGDDRQVIYWDLDSGAEIYRLGAGSAGHSGAVRSVDFSPDGRLAVSGGLSGSNIGNPGELILWNLESGQEIQRFEGHINGIVDARFTPDGKRILANAGDREITIEGEKVEGQVMNSDLRMWDVASAALVKKYDGIEHDIINLDVSPDGTQALLSSYYDTVISLIDLQSGQILASLEGHRNAVRTAVFLPDGRQALSASDDASLILWDLTTAQPLAVLRVGESGHLAAASLPGSQQAYSLTRNAELVTWDLQDASIVQRFGGIQDAIFDVAYSADGRQALSCAGAPAPDLPQRDESLVLWELQSGEALQSFFPPVEINFQCAISPDGRWILSGSDEGLVRLWDVESGAEIRKLNGHTDWVISLAFSPDSKHALTGSKDGSLIYWDLERGEPVHTMHSALNDNWALAISPDGRSALSDAAQGGTIYWDLESGSEIRRLVRADASEMPGLGGVAYLPDGESAITGEGDGNIIHWDLKTGQELRRFERHDGIRTRVEISRDGRLMLTSGMDGVLRLWDFESGELIHEFGYRGPAVVFDIALSPDGQTALSGSIDGQVTQWVIANPSLSGLLTWIEKNRTPRELSCEEKARYQIEPLCEQE